MRFGTSMAGLLSLSLSLAASSADAAVTFERTEEGGWYSPLASGYATVVAYRLLEEPAPETTDEPRPLPFEAAILDLLGEHVEEYDAMAVALLPLERALEVLPTLREAGHIAELETARGIAAFGHRFDPLDPATRRGRWEGRAEPSNALAGLAWVQFSHPIRSEWYASLGACFVEVLGHVPERTLLVAVASLEAVIECQEIVPYLAIVEPVLSTDRAAPAVIDSGEPIEATLAPGVTLEHIAASLPEADLYPIVTAPGSRLAVVRVEHRDAGRSLLDDARVVRLVPIGGTSAPSDERQGLILARQWVSSAQQGIPAEPTGPPYQNTYIDWLEGRLLYDDSGPSQYEQTITFFDTGVDDGSGSSTFHDDIEGRVIGAMDITVVGGDPGWGAFRAEDKSSHGTNVIGTAIGAGIDFGRTGSTRFAAGLGVAPQAKAISIRRYTPSGANCSFADHVMINESANLELAHHRARTGFFASTESTIANHSWNHGSSYDYDGGGGQPPVGPHEYEALANRFEALVRDASTRGAVDPMTIVFSAGNLGTATTTRIGRPANAKNVVTVGAVDSWAPAGTQNSCINTSDPIDGPFTVSSFSSRGPSFGGTSPGVHTVRVKPDVVAPGWRIEGPRRNTPPTSCPTGPCSYPPFGVESVTIPGPPTYAYGRGTSFAAPGVSGAVAQKSKQLRDGQPLLHPPWMASGIVPTPTLLKAALIATARSPGPVDPGTQVATCTGGDCRPSRHHGWGLVDLDRLTNREVGVFVRNEQTQFGTVGQFWPSPWLRIHSPSQEVLVALVWNDIPVTPANEALQRDLSLTVTVLGSSEYFLGNNFRENLGGLDDGYSSSLGFGGGGVADNVNNVEAVFLPAGTFAGADDQFRITVTSTTHTADTNYPNQSFSVYAWNVQCRKHDDVSCMAP